MLGLGPWAADRRVAIAVSGGADSLALALLVRRWSEHALALVVDHRLRPDSTTDAARACETLARLGIASQILSLHDLAPGSRLQERARRARHAVLARACAEAGMLDLLLGHHAADQDETVRMRARARSGPDGLAGMSPLSERRGLRLIRPLLAVPPPRLRATLIQAGIAWVEDPSNRDVRFERGRLRAQPTSSSLRSEPPERECVAEWLAQNVMIHEAGFAILPAGPIPSAALSRILQTLSGREHPPGRTEIERLAASPRAATLHGVRLLAAGRFGPGLVACRELAARAGPVPAADGAVWDRRFKLACRDIPRGWSLGPLTPAVEHRRPDLPAAVLPSLPAVYDERGRLRAAPFLSVHDADHEIDVIFEPDLPIAPSFFMTRGHSAP